MSSISNEHTRVAGLISGLETEDLVKAATSGTKTQINTRKQKLQTLQWKQEGYRDVISKIKDFQDKYLKIDSSSSIMANAVLKKCIAESSNDKYVSASAAAGATPATYTIKEAKAATAATVSTNGRCAEGSIKLDFSSAKQDTKYEVKVNLDGTDKTIVFTGGSNAAESQTNFLNAVNTAFSDIKGENQKFTMAGGWLKFDGGEDDGGIYHTFEVGICSEGLGLSSTAYSRINKASTLGSIGFTQALSGDSYDISINGKNFSFTADTTVSDMMNEINNSGAGVTISFSNVGQSFEIKTNETGKGQNITMYQTSGNLLNAMFNIDSKTLGTSTTDAARIEHEMNGAYTQELNDSITDQLTVGFESGTTWGLTLSIDGEEKSFSFDMNSLLSKKADDDTTTYTNTEITTAINTELQKQLKAAGYNENEISFSYSGGSITLNSTAHKLEIGANDFGLNTAEYGGTNIHTVTGDKGFVMAEGVTEMKFDINYDGYKITRTVKAGDGESITVNDLVESGMFKLRNDGTLVATGNISGADDASNKMLETYFGKTSITASADNDSITTEGSNSTLTVSTDGKNFVTYTSAENVFTFDGTNITLTGKNDFTAETEDDYITVETKKDTSGVKEVLTNFVNDYNQLLDDLYGVYNKSRPKSEGSYYDPLTEEQEEEMKDEEIEKWNENAKTGLLYRDNTIAKFLNEIRGVMARGTNGFTLKDMGITLTDNWTDNGKLQIDEAKMESAIEANSDRIADFFTNSETGLATRLSNTVDKAISTKTKNYGYLTSLAGMEGTKTDTDNQIYKQMQYIQEIIDALTEKYEKEQERYWDKYTQLETYMNNMQNQATSVFGTTTTG